MATTHTDKTVGQYVLEQPGLSRIFERFGIDYCCGGKKPLSDACQEKGVPLDEVLTALEQATSLAVEGEDLNWSEATVGQMIDHIDERHHQYLYQAMPRLAQMAHKVARVHGEKDARLSQLAQTFDALKAELEMHMRKEEEVLFPYCRQLDTSDSIPPFHCGNVGSPIRVMETEHESAGALLAKMNELSDGYMPPLWACNTYRALLDGLSEVERDIHRHIHEENNILFPKVLRMAGL